jgi:hypothetical protein
LDPEAREGVDQLLGVGMIRTLEDSLGWPFFDELTVLQNQGARTDRPHNLEIVADEQARKAAFTLQLYKKVEYLRLHRDIQRGYRFVGNHEFGLAGESPRNAYALALPPGKLVRKPGMETGFKTGCLQEPFRLCLALPRRKIEQCCFD